MKRKLREKWSALTDGLRAKLPRLSRPQRIVRNLICIPLAVLLVWLLAGGEALTPERAFRRAENFCMIGPSELLCEETYRYYYSTEYRWFLGETAEGYVSAKCGRTGGFPWGWYGQAVYWPRGEGATVVIREGTKNLGMYESAWFYVLGVPGSAVRAEVTIHSMSSGSLNGKPYDLDWLCTVYCEPNGEELLCGLLEIQDKTSDSWQAALEEIAVSDLFSPYADIPMTVRLYDVEDTIISEETFTYRYPGGR